MAMCRDCVSFKELDFVPSDRPGYQDIYGICDFEGALGLVKSDEDGSCDDFEQWEG
jgi:hypothetical protein